MLSWLFFIIITAFPVKYSDGNPALVFNLTWLVITLLCLTMQYHKNAVKYAEVIY
uniref:Uncharacterized protein n=1 Tax=Arsenophonus nasoniae TaxID=638 RepID=D2U0M6_9GAMM|nr:hypothetical protein ARN_20590 [Arsenophonus nasoniae]